MSNYEDAESIMVKDLIIKIEKFNSLCTKHKHFTNKLSDRYTALWWFAVGLREGIKRAEIIREKYNLED